MARKKHIKEASHIDEIEVKTDYALGEMSPYREWLEKTGNFSQEDSHLEPASANPDVLPEDEGMYFQDGCHDERLDLVMRVIDTLTPKQKIILQMCGNEGRTVENCAAKLGISRGTVQKTLDRIRAKVAVLQKGSFQG